MVKRKVKKSTGKRRSTSKRSTTSSKKKSITKKPKVSKVKRKTTKKSKVSKVKSKTTKKSKTADVTDCSIPSVNLVERKTTNKDIIAEIFIEEEIERLTGKGKNELPEDVTVWLDTLKSATPDQKLELAKHLKNLRAQLDTTHPKNIADSIESGGLPDVGPTEKGEKLTEPPEIPLEILRILVEMYYDFQNTRIRTGNRAAMNLERNGIGKDALEKYGVDGLFDTSKKFERDIVKLIAHDLKHRPIYTDYLQKIQGISVILAAGLIAWIQDPSNYTNISKLHQNAGLGQNRFCEECLKWAYEEFFIPKTDVDGKISETKAKRVSGKVEICNYCGNGKHLKFYPQTKVQGYQLNWNPKLKTHMWKIGGSFVLQKATKSWYRSIYDMERAKLDRRFPEAEQIEVRGKKRLQHNPKHRFEAAKRKVEKIFLGHLWLVWRIMEKKSITLPYMPKGEPLSNHRIIPPVVDNGELPELVRTELLKLHDQHGVYPSDLIPDWIDRTDKVKSDEEATLEENSTPPSDAPEGTSLPDVDVDVDDDETN